MVRTIKILSRINAFRKVFASLFLTFSVLSVYCSVKNDSLRFEVLLNSKMLKEIQMNEKFISSLEITSSRLILLSTTNQFYVLGWGGLKPIGVKNTGLIRSFAFTSDNLLMAIQNNELCGMDKLGSLSKIYHLPNEEMGISAGKYVMYVYDHNKEKTKQSLYLISHGGRYSKLFEIPTTFNSIVEYNNSLLFATENTVFRFDPKSKELKVFVALPKNEIIKSTAIDTSSNRIYFSTDRMIYAIKDSSAALVTDKFGGIIRFLDDGLIVFNPDKKYVIRIVGLEDKIASTIQELKTAANDKQIPDALINTTIIDMVKQKLSDGIIINMINRSTVNFNLSIDSMIYLSSQNVSSAIIMAMKNAMNSKISKESNKTNH